MVSEIITVGSQVKDFPGTGASPGSATSSWVDVDYSLGSLAPGDTPGAGVTAVPLGSPRGDVWFHGLHKVVGTGSVLNSGSAVVGIGFYAGDTLVAALIRNGALSTSRFVTRAYGDSTVSGAVAVTFAANQWTSFDVHFYEDESGFNVEAYIDGSLSSSATAPNTGGMPLPDNVRFASLASNQVNAWSEIIVTAGIPTLNWRLAELAPDGAGAYQEMAGDYTDLADPDPARVVLGKADGQRFSWLPSAYNGSTAQGGIAAVISKTTARRMVGAPTKIKNLLRVDGTVYFDSATLTGLQKDVVSIWWENPDTAAPWDAADFASLEVGFAVED